MKRLSAGLLVGLLTTAHAGTWSTSAWTGDASTGIVESETVWAYHFGSSTAATIDGVSVPGVASPPGTVAGKLEVWGFTSVLSPDLNNLTALGGNGSAVLGNTFFYGGDPASLTVKAGSPLVQGKDYVLSIFSVGWDEAPTARTVTFHSGSDQLSVNQNMFGENFGVRVDYAFTAGAGDQTVTIDRDVVTGTFHLYAVALRAVPDAPLVVTSTADSGAGSLRAAVTSVTGATPTKITFAPSLSGQTINLTSGEIAVSGNVTLDASSLPQGLTIRGNGTNRVFYVNSGAQLTGRVLTLTGGGGVGQGASGYGGAIENVGTLRLHDCTLRNNSASTGGGAIDNGGSSGSVSLINCALHDNSAQYGGAIDNYAGTTSLLNSTFTRNRATLNGAVVFNEFNGTLEVVHCTVVENFGPVTSSTGALDASSGVIAVSSSIVAGNGGGDVRANSGNFNSGGGNVIGTGSGASAFTNTGDVRDVTAAQVALAELGRYGGRTDTMPPLPGSPALDAAVTSTTATDQRGFARSVDGNFDSSTVSDSGAAESFVVRCTTSADQLDTPSGSAVSLREAARDAPAGAVITTVSTNLFSLTRGEVVVDKPLILSASSQSVRWAITPGFGKRMFYIAPGARVHFSRLDIGAFGASLGGGRGAVESGKGGCLLNQGDLSITDCLFTGLAADYGGLMANGMAATPSHLLLRRCSLRSSTAAADGGAIYNATANGGSAAVELENCLLTSNTAGRNGGALFNFTGHGNATLAAVHCTVMNNKATRSGGGLYNGENFGIGTSTLTSCVIAMNTAPTGPDVTWQDGSINSGGTNLIGVADADGPAWSVTDLTGTPAAPLSPQLDSVNFNPLAGSPVLDAAAASTILLDRSRQPRTAEGDFTGAALPDIGATEATTISVTTTADELDTPAGGSVSLREAIRDSGSNGIIRLDAALNGQTLTLDQARGEIALSKSFSLDASQVPGGFTIDGGPGANRLFTVSGSATVLLRGLTLQGGAATGDGGAILVSGGRLTLEDCVLTGNTATGSGGALASTSFFNSLTITRCSFTNNAAAFQGGAIHVAAATSIPGVQLSQCTIEGNRSGLRGGGLSCTSSSLSVDQCTFTRNEAAKQHGGGIVVDLGSYNTSLSNSIVADNRAPASPDLVVEATGIFTRSGTNLIGVQPSTGVAVPAGLPNANGDYVGSSTVPLAPLISPLGYYGGRTPTCLPMPGSPALDRATGVTSLTDQRGFARSVDGNADGTALPDIGAAESVMVRVDVANDELDTPAGTNDVSLREAVRDAPAGAVIGFAPALSGHTIRVSSALSPSRALVISGSGLAQPVTLSALPGPSGSNVLGVGAGNSVGLSHLRFFGCSTPGDGGAILNFGRLGMTDCELSYNSNTSTAGIGGAIYSGTSGQSSWLKMTRCVLSGNYSIIGNGGALVNRSTAAGLTAEALLEDCVLSGNSAMAPSAGVGGAISNLSSNGTAQLTARRCTFSDNQSAARAGAVNNSTSSNSTAIAITTLDGCTLSGNACPFGSGGAVANYASQGKTSLDLLQCTLVNNRSSSEGGAVLNNGVGGTVNVRIKQCTITGNVSGGTGGAVTDMQFAGVTTLTLDSSIVAGNLPANRPDVLEVNTGTIVSLGNNLIGNTDNSRFTWPSGDLTGTTAAPLDPLLAPLDFYGGPTQTMPPLPGSPAREPASGATTATGLADQRGLPRLVGAKVDIGAVEADAPDAPGVIAFGSAVVRVNEGDAPAMIPVYRTAGTIGTVTVKATTTTGSGTGFATSPDDFGAVTNYLLTFGPGETVKYVPITIVADPTLKEPNETFTLTLSDVTGNATLGTQSITIVRIIDAYDASAPTLTLTAPAANAIVPQASGPGVTVSGTAKDDKGVQSVQVQLNGGPFVDAVLSGPSTAPGFTLLITGTPGVNSLVVRTVDEKGKISALVKRSFTYKVTQTLTVIVSGPANSGTISAGFMPTSQRDVGVKYTVTATPKPGFAFIGWGYSQSTTVHPVPSAGIGELDIIKPTLTFIMQPGLTLIANFYNTPFTPSAVGTHTGLILPSTTEPAPNGTTPGNATTGLFTVTLTSKGTLITGSLKIDGTSLPFIGTVPPYGDAIYFGTGATSTTTLKFVRSGKPDLDLTISNEFDYANAFSGKLTQKVGGVTQAVSTFMAYRSAYSATAKVPSTLVSGSSQRFNLMLQPVSPQPGLTAAQFPQGNGIGYLTLGSSGSCSFAGSLADGTPFTASGALNANNECPLFASLYASKGHLAGIVNVVLPTTPSYDAYAVNMLWNRPVQLPTKVQWYPSGWPTSINLDLVGAKFTVPAASANQSVIPGLGALDGTNTVGNAVFYARDGLLTSERSYGVNISTKNVVTPLPLTTPNFTLKLTAATGELSGTFLHTDGTKPAFKATTLQKPGDYQGSYGWFLSTSPKVPNGQGQGGEVKLLAR